LVEVEGSRTKALSTIAEKLMTLSIMPNELRR